MEESASGRYDARQPRYTSVRNHQCLTARQSDGVVDGATRWVAPVEETDSITLRYTLDIGLTRQAVTELMIQWHSNVKGDLEARILEVQGFGSLFL